MVDGTYKDLTNTMRVRHETLVTGIVYEADNEPPTRASTSNWIDLTVDWAETEARTFNRDAGIRVRKSGTIISGVHVATVPQGDDAALKIAQTIKDNFTEVDADGVSYGSPGIGEIGRDVTGQYFRVEVFTPFRSDSSFAVPARVAGSVTDLDDVHDTVRTRFGTDVEDALGITVLYDNARPDVIPVSRSTWVRLAVSTGINQLVLGGTRKLYRVQGWFFAMIMTQAGKGDGAALDVVDGIDSAFRGVKDSGIHYGPVSLSVAGHTEAGHEGGAWFQHNARTPFYFEVNN